MPEAAESRREQYRKPYSESSVFIAWIMGEVVTGVERGAIGQHLLLMARQGLYKIHTSAWTMAEVHKKRHVPALSTRQDEDILAFFEHEFIELMAVDRQIGELANRIAREHSILPGDAVHLASAIHAGCECVLSWDQNLTKRTDLPIPVEAPQVLGQATFFGDSG